MWWRPIVEEIKWYEKYNGSKFLTKDMKKFLDQYTEEEFCNDFKILSEAGLAIDVYRLRPIYLVDAVTSMMQIE